MFRTKNHSLNVILIIAIMLFLGHILGLFASYSTLLGHYFKIVTLLLPLVLAFSIFTMNWFAYSKVKDNHSLFLGATFFFIGVFDLFHMLSYPFMPEFITLNSPQKAASFWMEARLGSAFLFIASAYVHKDTFPKVINKLVLIILVFFSTILSVGMMIYYPDLMFSFNNQDGFPNTAGIYLLIIIVFAVLYSANLYYKKLRETGQKSIICFLYGFVIIAVSVIIDPFYDFSGHLLKAAGFYFIYFGLFKSSIEQPYEKMADTEHKLRFVAEEKYMNLFDNANDAIILTDLENNITAWNHGAENIFLWKKNEVLGKNFMQFMVPPQLEEERIQITRNVLEGKAVTGFDTVRVRKDGKEIDVSMTLSPLLNPDNDIIGLSSIIRDITEQKQAQEAIQESEARYRKLVELSPDAIVVSCQGKIVFINAAGAKLFGAEYPEQIIGKDLMDFVHPDHKNNVRIRIRQIIENEKEVPMVEEKFVKSDGTVIDVEDVAIPFTFQGKPAVQIVINDVTQRKLAQEAMLESETRYRKLVELSPDAIAVFCEGKIVFINAAGAKLFGAGDTEQIIGKDLLDFVHPDNKNTLQARFQQIIETGKEAPMVEEKFIQFNGNVIDIEEVAIPFTFHGKPAVQIVINDVTQRKLTQEALKRSEEHFRSLIENSSDIITILNDEGNIIYVSPSIERSLGYTPSELIWQNMVKILHPDDVSLFFDPFFKNIRTLDTTTSIEVRIIHKEGSIRTLEHIGKKLPRGLVVSGVVLNSRDVTERKIAQEQISSSLAEKEVLLREIHHRVKNNMQIISSLLHLQENSIKDETVIDMFKDSRNRILSMSLIHEKLYRSSNFSKIDFSGYIKDLAGNLLQSYGADMNRIKLNIQAENVFIGLDSAIPCGLIINELITNSLKYAFPGDKKGEIRIILSSTDDSMIGLRVGDDGVGIPDDIDLGTVKSLGLHLVKILAENQLDGKIEINREKGTEFQISFKDVK